MKRTQISTGIALVALCSSTLCGHAAQRKAAIAQLPGGGRTNVDESGRGFEEPRQETRARPESVKPVAAPGKAATEGGTVRLVADWLPLTHGDTHSSILLYRAVSQTGGMPLDEVSDVLGANPGDLRREFRLEKQEYLLGEPILLEFAVALRGKGTWREETYSLRPHRRNHKIFFLMRHADGEWVRDPEGANYGSGAGGGIWPRDIRSGETMSQWFGLQRWCMIEKPGDYDLFCFRLERSHGEYDHYRRQYEKVEMTIRDEAFNPVLKEIPESVRKAAERHFDVKMTSDYAHLRLRIRAGSAEQRREMIEDYTGQVLKPPTSTHPNYRPPNDKSAALREAILYSRQDDFLPLLKQWLDATGGPHNECLSALAIRATPAAMALLGEHGPVMTWWAIGNLHPTHRPSLMPWMIQWITHEDPEMRRKAVIVVRSWSGQTFEPERGLLDEDESLTLDDCVQIRRMAEDWWKKNRTDFIADPSGKDIRHIGPL